MVDKIQCRVLGYCLTLMLQLVNLVLFIQALYTPKSQQVEAILAMRWKYMTVWNLFIQGGYAIIGLICDVPILLKIEVKYDLLNQLRWYRSILFSGLFWPCGLFVFTIFWPIFIYDRELIFPAAIDTALSPVSNHIMHTAIFPIVLWEFLFAERKAAITDSLAKFHVITLVSAYNVVLFSSYYYNGEWPYPIMKDVYGTIYFPLLYLYVIGHCVFSYYIQWHIPDVLNLNEKSYEKDR